MELTIEEALQQGIAAHKEGRLEEAERIYRAVLIIDPKHVDANHNLGVIAVSVNQSAVALPLFRTALEADPTIEQFWLSYIDALIKENEYDNAKRCLDLGKKQGLFKDKVDALSQYLAEAAKDETPPESQLTKLLEQYQSGRYDEAETSARSMIRQFPSYGGSWKVLGAALNKLGRRSESLLANQKAVLLAPEDAEAHSNLGVALKESGRLVEAEVSFAQSIGLNPSSAKAHSNLGNTLSSLGRLKEAEASYKRAININPEFAEAHSNLGTALQELGKLEEAEASYKQAIKIRPDFVEAYRHLTSVKEQGWADEYFVQMQKLCLDPSLSDAQRCHLNFALGKACEDLDQLSSSFEHYAAGNGLRKKILAYDISQDIELFGQLKQMHPIIDKSSLKVDGLSEGPQVTFVLGMPRSGTTLVEQIISSHSAATAGGELPYVENYGSSIARGEQKISAESLLDFRAKYLEKVQKLSKESSIITDKLPLNFRFIGLICAAFPDAKIVHVKRDPAATCWGNYKQYFASGSLGYCYDTEDLVAYYRLYQDLMQFWQERYGRRIYTLDYEMLTTNQQEETQKLIQYIGLDWEDECLSPESNAKSVSTASSVQVRKKVYQGSSKVWRKFEPFLKGAFDSLGA